MARIAGVNIPDNKRIEIALTYIKGIGLTLSKKVLAIAQLDPNSRVKDVKGDDLGRLQKIIEDNYTVEGELKRLILGNIKRLRDIRCRRGNFHERHLPVRGQHTRYNARTTRSSKGKKKIAVGGTSFKKIKASASEKT